eukprot:7332933-Karenia_brevis.AAC.1
MYNIGPDDDDNPSNFVHVDTNASGVGGCPPNDTKKSEGLSSMHVHTHTVDDEDGILVDMRTCARAEGFPMRLDVPFE